MSEIFNKIAELSKKYEMETAKILSRLIQTPSFSAKEKDVVERIKAEMQTIGFDEIKIDGLGSIVGRIGNGPKLIAFDAHIDTVYPGEKTNWNFDPFEGGIREGKVWGRGTADQKGGMASMLGAAKLIKELGLNKDCTILFTGTVMEEDCDGLCWQHLIREEGIKPDLVVITEPTSLNIYRGQRGRMEMTIEIKGISCHGSAPERGDNAIYKMSRIAIEIEKLNERLKVDPFLGKGTITASVFESGSPSQCAVADFSKVQVDRRLTIGENKDSAVAELQDCAVKAGYKDAKVKVLQYDETAYTGKKYGMEKYFPCWVMEESSPWLKNAVDAFEKVFTKKPKVDKWTFSTNGVATAGLYNIPTFGFGPGNEEQAHAPNEWINISDLSAAAAFYASLIAEINGI